MRLGLAPAALACCISVVSAGAAAGLTAEPVAVMQGLDKITARVSRFDAPVGKPVSFGTLSVVVRDCEKSAPEERPENAAFVQIYENRPGEEPVRRFSGWMFSSSPALSALEHPVYDVNLLECEPASAPPAPPPAAPAPPAPSSNPPGKSRGKAAR